MNPYCAELSLNISPVIDMEIVYSQKVALQTISVSKINPELLEMVANLGMSINHIESFKRPAGNESFIHSDQFDRKEFVKMNWIYGGKSSSMIWYDPIPGMPVQHRFTMSNAPYILYDKKNVMQVHKVQTKNNKVYLIQAGYPHQIINPLEDRYCVSCVLSLENGARISMSEAQVKLSELIVND